ncbi:MAG: PAS domain-containing sensor histidine kinase [Desulfobacterales bacterium]|nr:PAS domain-containing sensor histidine kinase [Desulfobacterales bacterium]
MINTYFAPAEKAKENDLVAEIEIVSRSPIVSGLLISVSGLLAVIDEHRQIIALNDSFLKMLGIEDPGKALGLRPGDVLQCIHAHDEPAGCGTTKFCSTCGLAIAIVSSLGQDKPVERICALSANRGDKKVDIALLVRSQPIKIDKRRFLLLFLQDITQQQQRAALERTFFHDVNNMLSILVGASELLVNKYPSKLAKNIHRASLRLHKEIAIQQCLSQTETCSYQPIRHEITTEQTLAELKSFFSSHPVARNKKIEFQENYPDVSINTDISLLSRVLCNMIINALEATEENGIVKFWIELEGDRLSFCVWNAQEIPQKITNRIFQRNFSTKKQAGRGIGTFSMKLFGEKILGGKVDFKTSKEEGTVFKFSLPL